MQEPNLASDPDSGSSLEKDPWIPSLGDPPAPIKVDSHLPASARERPIGHEIMTWPHEDDRDKLSPKVPRPPSGADEH